MTENEQPQPDQQQDQQPDKQPEESNIIPIQRDQSDSTSQSPPVFSPSPGPTPGKTNGQPTRAPLPIPPASISLSPAQIPGQPKPFALLTITRPGSMTQVLLSAQELDGLIDGSNKVLMMIRSGIVLAEKMPPIDPRDGKK